MSIVTSKPEVTPETLLLMPDGDLFELVDGQLEERHTGFWSSYVGARFSSIIGEYVSLKALGWVCGVGCGYQCFADDPSRVRKPNVSFIRFGRLEGESLPEGHVGIAPDLAVEVLTPKDFCYKTTRKIEEYLRAGVRLVWVVNPDTRTVLIYRSDGTILGLREPDELSGEDTLPGFRCRVGDLFITPSPP
ncbi:Uma2 family endonuclease [Singulisphaera rosea]